MNPLCCDNSGTLTFILWFDLAIKIIDYKLVRMVYAHGDGQYLLLPRVDIYALSSGMLKGFW